MSIIQKKQKARSSGSSLQRSRNRNHTSGPGAAAAAAAASSRSSNRQTKVTNHGFYFGEAQAAERDLEKIEKEQARDRKRREQRLEELERGNAPSSSWNDTSSLNIPAASTSAAAIAGLLAGRQAGLETDFDDIPTPSSLPTSTTSKKKQNAELRRLLTQRRNLKLLLEDASASPILKSAPINFLQALHVEQRYPVHRATASVCSICGYWGDIRCRRCHERVCGLKCGATHDETRCDRPL